LAAWRRRAEATRCARLKDFVVEAAPTRLTKTSLTHQMLSSWSWGIHLPVEIRA
jgi:hypothetical protein